MVREKGKPEILNTQKGGDSYRYLKGNYEVETLTLPRRIFDIEVNPNKVSEIVLPTPGLVNLNSINKGYGSLFEILADGSQNWVYNLDQNTPQQALNLLPGTYKVAFRIREARGSKYTGVKTFEVKSGKTLVVNIFN